MVMGNSQFREDEDMPEGVKREMRGLYTPPTGMGSTRDQAILAAARAAAGGGRRFGWKAAAGLAIAACVALAGTLFVVEHRATDRAMESGAPGVAQVYQRTGDIRDAFYLARQL